MRMSTMGSTSTRTSKSHSGTCSFSNGYVILTSPVGTNRRLGVTVSTPARMQMSTSMKSQFPRSYTCHHRFKFAPEKHDEGALKLETGSDLPSTRGLLGVAGAMAAAPPSFNIFKGETSELNRKKKKERRERGKSEGGNARCAQSGSIVRHWLPLGGVHLFLLMLDDWNKPALNAAIEFRGSTHYTTLRSLSVMRLPE
jgi:hypothetical protein